jgi:putative oxidoreductase
MYSIIATQVATANKAITDASATSAAQIGASCCALLLRVSLGALFIAHLYWKLRLSPHGVATWWAHFEAAGYNAVELTYVLSAEIAGALLLIPGLWTRWVSLYALPFMIGATYYWLVRTGFYFVNSGCELPAVWCVLLLAQAFLGDGAFAMGSRPRAL